MTSSPGELVNEILNSKKYRGLGIPEETIKDLIQQEESKTNSAKELKKKVRQKLHQITAPYLGDPDYDEAEQELLQISDQRDMILFARKMLGHHASTHERLPYMSSFYKEIFAMTGKPDSILDLACGLNPFALPFMNLSPDTKYFAFDIHKPRLQLIEKFFTRSGFTKAEIFHQDILVKVPEYSADVAFLFKEAHRMDQRQRGCNEDLWKSLNVKFLLVSLPTKSLSGSHDLRKRMDKLVDESVAFTNWEISTHNFEDEIVYCIDKGKA